MGDGTMAALDAERSCQGTGHACAYVRFIFYRPPQIMITESQGKSNNYIYFWMKMIQISNDGRINMMKGPKMSVSRSYLKIRYGLEMYNVTIL